MTGREPDEDDQFNLPLELKKTAAKLTREGVKISVTPSELVRLMGHADDALNGDSNDAEHDALYYLREWLSEAYESPKRRNKV